MIPLSEIKTQVLASYEKLKYTPRGNQEQICIQVLDTFLNKEKSNVVLGAPTGVGKSILGAVISDALDQLTPELPGKASIIAMGTLMLSQQYYDSFSSLDKYKVFQIQGASNYPCAFMESQPSATSKTAEECVFKQLIPFEQEKYCSGCEYNAAKKLVNKTDILITNYAYYLIGMLASSHLGERKLTVFDEAHDINNIFCNYTEIMLSVHNIDRYIKELTDTNGKCDNEVAALIMLKEKITSKTIDDGNYRDVLKIIQQLYSTIAGILYTQSKLLVGHDTVKAGKYDKMGRKYEG